MEKKKRKQYQKAIAILRKAGIQKDDLLFAACSAANNSEKDVIEFIELLLEEGVYPNVWNNGLTALMSAAFNYPHKTGPEIICLFALYGANLNSKDVEGCTAIVYAARGAIIDNIKELWVWGANVLEEDGLSSKALEQAGWNLSGFGRRRRIRLAESLLEKLCVLEYRERGDYFA